MCKEAICYVHSANLEHPATVVVPAAGIEWALYLSEEFEAFLNSFSLLGWNEKALFVSACIFLYGYLLYVCALYTVGWKGVIDICGIIELIHRKEKVYLEWYGNVAT